MHFNLSAEADACRPRESAAPRSRAASRLAAAFLAKGLCFPAAAAHAHEYKLGALVIEHPWARATPPGAKVGGGYMVIENGGGEADRLVSVTAEAAGKAEIHEMSVDNGVMTMRPVEGGLEVPAGSSVALRPGSYHLMLMDLAQPLEEGERFKGTLTFEKAGEVDIEFKVESMGFAGPDGGKAMHDGMTH